jgi:hypothetical protein
MTQLGAEAPVAAKAAPVATTTTTPETAAKATPTSTAARWTGRIMSAVAALFLLMDAVMKLVKPAPVVEGTLDLGYPADSITGIGITLLVCTIIYCVPRTGILGAVLLTGYLGGAGRQR